MVMTAAGGGRKKKAVIAGVDGVPAELLLDMVGKGHMPGLKEILSSGYRLRPMKASLPDISSVSWTSFMTGANPGEHGVFGFTDLKPGTYQLVFPNSTTIAVAPFWQSLYDGGSIGRSIILNIPNTYPALPMPGVLVSGFVAIDFNRAVYPPRYAALLKGMGYVIDVETEKATTDPGGFRADLTASLRAREAAAMHLFNEEEWDIFLVVVTETDRLHHFFFDKKEEPFFSDVYQRTDRLISGLYRAAAQRYGEDLLFMILSDHGFTTLKTEVNLNAFLLREGFLRLDRTKQFYDRIDSGSRAFAMDPGRIYLHHRDRYPRGDVAKADAQALKSDLTAALLGLRDDNGNPVIRSVFDGEEIYRGPLAHLGPDLVCLPFDGCDLKGNMRKEEVFTKGAFSGMHTRDNALLIVPGSLNVDDELTIEFPAKAIARHFAP